MKLNSLDDANTALGQFTPSLQTFIPGYSLERALNFLNKIGNPQDKYRVIHIAGTSGKTSTAYFIRALLQESGKTTGLTTSPHIVNITERVQINGQPLPEDAFLSLLGEFLELVKNASATLTYFETITCFAFWVFAHYRVDYAVIETGVGGLLDPTNAVVSENKICVITNLGIDHAGILGNTIEEIALQKAGIIHAGNSVFVVDQDAAPLSVIKKYAANQDARLKIIKPNPLQPSSLPPFQRANWSLALSVFYSVQPGGLRDDLLKRAEHTQPPGRFEIINVMDKTVILDGAHNPQKLGAFADSIKMVSVNKIPVLFGSISISQERLTENLLAVKAITSHLTATALVCELLGQKKNSLPAKDIAETAKYIGIEARSQSDLNKALEELLQTPEPTVAITGSFQIVGQARKILENLQ